MSDWRNQNPTLRPELDERAAASDALIVTAYYQFVNAIKALSVGDIDGEYRQQAMTLAWNAYDMAKDGLRERTKEREFEREKEVLKAWREGRLIEKTEAR